MSTGAESRMSIGEVERLSGTPITTLRYYERRGLIDPPERVSGQRRYRPDVLARLMLIRFCRVAGLSLDEIAVVIAERTTARAQTKALAARRIEAIDAQLAELELARAMMSAALECSCPGMDECDCGAFAAVVERVRNALSDAGSH